MFYKILLYYLYKRRGGENVGKRKKSWGGLGMEETLVVVLSPGKISKF